MSGTEHVANLSQLRPGLWVRSGAENEYFSAMTIYTLLDRGLAALTETGEGGNQALIEKGINRCTAGITSLVTP